MLSIILGLRGRITGYDSDNGEYLVFKIENGKYSCIAAGTSKFLVFLKGIL